MWEDDLGWRPCSRAEPRRQAAGRSEAASASTTCLGFRVKGSGSLEDPMPSLGLSFPFCHLLSPRKTPLGRVDGHPDLKVLAPVTVQM